jgi:hypothetical protein
MPWDGSFVPAATWRKEENEEYTLWDEVDTWDVHSDHEPDLRRDGRIDVIRRRRELGCEWVQCPIRTRLIMCWVPPGMDSHISLPLWIDHQSLRLIDCEDLLPPGHGWPLLIRWNSSPALAIGCPCRHIMWIIV